MFQFATNSSTLLDKNIREPLQNGQYIHVNVALSRTFFIGENTQNTVGMTLARIVGIITGPKYKFR